jgi:hypothetical protein
MFMCAAVRLKFGIPWISDEACHILRQRFWVSQSSTESLLGHKDITVGSDRGPEET